MKRFMLILQETIVVLHKNKMRTRAEPKQTSLTRYFSPSPVFLFFCSRPNFRTAKTSKFASETLATQATALQAQLQALRDMAGVDIDALF